MTKINHCDKINSAIMKNEKKSKKGENMAENIISKLKTNINFLTNVEKKIAALIIENPGEFITYSMHELVKKADVSQGSIINFSKKKAYERKKWNFVK